MLEVKALEGLGTTVDVVLINGVLREGDTVVVAGLHGPLVGGWLCPLACPALASLACLRLHYRACMSALACLRLHDCARMSAVDA